MFVFFHSLFLQMVAFFQTVFTFYHQGFELAKDFAHYKTALQINIQNVRNTGSSWRWNWNRCNSNYWIIEIDTNVWQFALVEIINEISFFFFLSQTRNRFEGARSEVYELMKRIREAPQEYRQTSPISCEGYLYVQEKRKTSVIIQDL